jgi:endogenous inhibitor of DNA gyrase (YacG/DUF329 family)
MNKPAGGDGSGCPMCGKPMDQAHRPFCSSRCKTIDLGRWLDGDYRLPSEDAPDEAEIIDLASHVRAEG